MTVFPYPSHCAGTGPRFSITALRLDCSCQDDLSLALYFKTRVDTQCGLPVTVGDGDGYPVELTRGSGAPESYALSITPEKAVLIAADRSGVLYGLMTLLQLMDGLPGMPAPTTLPSCEITDAPFKKRRGVHVYMAARENIPDFLCMIDGLASLKMNTIILETGAGMEFDRHPEINAAWKKLTRDIALFPGGPRHVQMSEVYWKDSIHTEIAGGGCLTQNEVRAIVRYAKDLCFDVIPEVQNLSHAYYLTIAHREIAERPNEPFPDSTCPMHPGAYALYFDVAEEILEVFQPKTVSIGHDEVRILGCCPRCKGKSGAELLSYEINRLYGFYKARGIEVAMWGEKLMDLTSYTGRKMGGTAEYKKDDRGRVWDLPETFGAIDRIPKDIVQLDWYHMLARDTSAIFTDKGFQKVWYGNFHADTLKDVVGRLGAPSVEGAEVSSWDLACEPTMGRDGIFFQFAWGAGVLWSEKYRDDGFAWDNRAVIEFMPYLRGILRPWKEQSRAPLTVFYLGGDAPALRTSRPRSFYLGEALYRTIWGEEAAAATSLLHQEIEAAIGRAVSSLVFVTACDRKMRVPHSIEFEDTTANVLGMFYVFYEDGSTEPVELRYGAGVGTLHMDWGRSSSPPANSLDEIDADMGDTEAEAPFFHIADSARDALCYLTDPIAFTGEDGGDYTLYALAWRNPRPEAKIAAVRHVMTIDREKLPGQMAYLFAIAGV